MRDAKLGHVNSMAMGTHLKHALASDAREWIVRVLVRDEPDVSNIITTLASEAHTIDIHSTIEKGFVHQPLTGRSLHTPEMAKATSDAVPQTYKPRHDSGANHSSPWAQGDSHDLGELTVKQLIIQTIGDKCACCKRDMSGEGKTAYGLAKFKIPDCDLELIFICLDCCRHANDLMKGGRFIANDFIDGVGPRPAPSRWASSTKPKAAMMRT